ncbi:uncharacterized protein [Rutidosis leptorrhynchoides]|uniref:uncharacterized protein n=1 Tax=Rutidosis leptorrhynchoides TaxID=125765 RepID=UPI003A991287
MVRMLLGREEMDRNTWMHEIGRATSDFMDSVDEFITVAETDQLEKGNTAISCPCKKCKNARWYADSTDIKSHLIAHGFMRGYTCWSFHGESLADLNPSVSDNDTDNEDDSYNSDNNVNFDDMFDDLDMEDNVADKYHDRLPQLFVDAEKPLYTGCMNFSKLSAVIQLVNLKSNNGWSDTSFTSLLELLNKMLPEGNEFLVSTYQAKKLMYKCGKPTDNVDSDVSKNGPPAKLLWYLPIIPRLKRLFANEKDAKLLRWHAEDRKNDGKMRHVADSLQWKNFDKDFEEFGDEIRNIRFGLSSDGINPFGDLSSRHSTWPVLLCIYNLPPWLCMKRKYIMMSLLIQGPKQPGNDIDVYLQPLVDEMMELWSTGIHGKKACPICEENTQSIWLTNCKKPAFMGHRRELAENHPYRKKEDLFDGTIEDRKLPAPLDGETTLSKVANIKVVLGKKGFGPPKGLLLNIPGKTKDGIKVRRDMELMNIIPELQPKDIDGRSTKFLPPACYTMSKVEKTKFCQCLHGIKVPSGYSANIRKLVSMKDLKLLGMKSHDCHVLMTQMILIAIRGILPNRIRHTITKLCLFFNMIHSKVIDPDVLDEYQRDIILTLCELEMYFPPSFFDVMVHLVSHIVGEIKACGPVFLRYMYPFERCMGILKGYVRNLNRPKGSIVEGYASEEVIEFCTNYMDGFKSVGIPQSRHEGRLVGQGTLGCKTAIQMLPIIKRLILMSYNTLHLLIRSLHMAFLRQQNLKKSAKWRTLPNIDKTVEALGFAPKHVFQYQGYDINGYTFYTKTQDKKSKTQNSGVTVIASSTEFTMVNREERSRIAKKSYYGVIQEIWELDYGDSYTIPLFKCKWVDNDLGVQVDEDGFTTVNLSTNGYKEEPFILEKLVTQVFFIEDPKDPRWHVVQYGK